MKTMRVFGMEVEIPTKGDKCPFCNGKGYIEVVNPYDKRLGNVEMKCCSCAGTGIYKQRTNFQRITESEEALAEYLAKNYDYCTYADCDNCPVNNEDGFCENEGKTDYEIWLWWLKQESE